MTSHPLQSKATLPACRLAVLIPEFPGQTHSFFWREIEALESAHGSGAQIISTRLAPKPAWHDWVERARAIQLYPLPKAELAGLLPELSAALPHTLIEAAGLLRSRHPDLSFRIRIAGEDEQGGTGYHRDLSAAIEAAGLGGVVQLLGSVTQAAVRNELQSADGFVLASRHEPLGVAYMEAMACDLPVIGTEAGGVRELIVQDRDGILVPPGNAEVLAKAMLRLMENPEMGQSLGTAARDRIIEEFSSRRSVDALALGDLS